MFPSRHAIFWEYSLSDPSTFLKVFDGKVVFVLKVYDFIITNVDYLANSSNHEVMFPEYSNCLFQKYSKDIPRIL